MQLKHCNWNYGCILVEGMKMYIKTDQDNLQAIAPSGFSIESATIPEVSCVTVTSCDQGICIIPEQF